MPVIETGFASNAPFNLGISREAWSFETKRASGTSTLGQEDVENESRIACLTSENLEKITPSDMRLPARMYDRNCAKSRFMESAASD